MKVKRKRGWLGNYDSVNDSDNDIKFYYDNFNFE